VHRILVIAILASGAAARADVAGEVSAGTGGDTTASGGFATASATFTARLDHPEASLVDRALPGDPSKPPNPGPFYVWLFTGLDADERMTAGAAGSGELHVVPDGAIGTAKGRAWVHAYGWGLEARTAIQPIGDLRDRFWRPGRDIVQWNAALDVPAMWSIGTARTQVLAGLWRLDLGHRRAIGGGDWHSAGWDRAVDFTFVRVQQPRLVIDFITGSYSELGIARSTSGVTEYGTSATAIDLDVAAARWQLADHIAIVARAGLAMRMPISPYMVTGTSENSVGPDATTPSYWLELQHTRDTEHATLGAGTWSRLDPSGHAVDSGHLVAASVDTRRGRVSLGGMLELGRLRRIVIGDLAPDGLAPLGTTMWMGRGELVAGLRIAHDLDLVGTAWLERSDRDDPRWVVPSDGTLATHAGGDVTARWRFHRL